MVVLVVLVVTDQAPVLAPAVQVLLGSMGQLMLVVVTAVLKVAITALLRASPALLIQATAVERPIQAALELWSFVTQTQAGKKVLAAL